MTAKGTAQTDDQKRETAAAMRRYWQSPEGRARKAALRAAGNEARREARLARAQTPRG